MSSVSVIIPEHKENECSVPMLDILEENIPSLREVIFVTSNANLKVAKKYGFSIRVIPNVHSAGMARNKGAFAATSDVLMFADCHVCFHTDIAPLFDTLEKNPNSVVTGGIQPTDFPSCETKWSGIGWGVYFDGWWNWHWGTKSGSEAVFPVPFSCACFEVMRKQTFLNSVWGFITVRGLGIEEEMNMRLARLGMSTLCDSRVVVGHVFKTADGNFGERHDLEYAKAIATVLNIFDEEVYANVVADGRRQIGNRCDEALNRAFKSHGDKRKYMERNAVKTLDEKWFLKIKR